MPTVGEIVALVESLAPASLAEEWDNVGLLVGDPGADAGRVMTCLTLTPGSVAEAVEKDARLVVAHHPLPFHPLKRLTTETVEGRMLWQLARAGVAVCSPHTAFDSAADGVNQRLADGLGLTDATPLTPDADDPAIGTGRVALTTNKTRTLAGLAAAAKGFLQLDAVRAVGADDQPVSRVAIACGSGASMLDAAVAAGCDAMVTGEASFHHCLAAESRGVALLLLGHYASERFAVEALAGLLAERLPGARVWASDAEHDPLRVF